MKYEVEVPAEIALRLTQKASEVGRDVPHLIRIAVDQFVADESVSDTNGCWSSEMQAPRGDLIDKDIADTITDEEQVELSRLDRLANEHFDRISPPPGFGRLLREF